MAPAVLAVAMVASPVLPAMTAFAGVTGGGTNGNTVGNETQLNQLDTIKPTEADTPDAKVELRVIKTLYLSTDMPGGKVPTINYNGENAWTEVIKDLNTKSLRPYLGAEYGNIQFRLFKIDETKAPADADKTQITDAIEAAIVNNTALPEYVSVVETKDTADTDGIATASFSVDNKGTYVIGELSRDNTKIQSYARPILLQLPMTNKNGSKYLNGTIPLYPKNEVKVSDQEFHKYSKLIGQAAQKMQGAKFNILAAPLQSLTEDGKTQDTTIANGMYLGSVKNGNILGALTAKQADARTFITNAEGDLIAEDDKDYAPLKDLQAGWRYWLVEVDSDAVDAFGSDKTPTTTTYLGSPFAFNDANNKLAIAVSNTGVVTLENPDKFNELINYEKPSVKKEITNKSDSDTYGVGSKNVVNFKSTVKIPDDLEGYETLQWHDKVTLGAETTKNTDVKLAENSLVLKTAGGETLEKDVDYKVVTNGDDSILIDFINVGNEKKPSDKVKKAGSIDITYGMFIGSTKELGTDYFNGAKMTYKNSPSDKSKLRETPEEKQKFKTYGFTLKKAAGNILGLATDQGLEGAIFRIRDKATGKYLFKEAANDNGGVDGYTLKEFANEADIPEKCNFTSNSKGFIEVSGIPAGTYEVIETKAPAGYQLPTNGRIQEITVTAETSTPDVDITVVNVKSEAVVTGTRTGLGIIILALISMGGVLVTRRKKEEEAVNA